MSLEFKSKSQNPMFSQVIDIAPQDVLDFKNQIVLIDVREPQEFVGELGHIAGSSLIPVGEFTQRIAEVPKDQTVVFICRSGNRSAHAAAFAHEQGYTQIYNMKGGMLLWNQLMLPIERN